MAQLNPKRKAATAQHKSNGHVGAHSPRRETSKLSAGSAINVGQRAALDNRDIRAGRVRQDFSGFKGVVGDIAKFLARYVVLPETSFLVIATWIVAANLVDQWDRFPHLAVTSPEKRCGKTLLLELLFLLVPRPRYTTNISPAALYRLVELEKPTLLMDESQSLSRRGSEASEVIREILNAGISRNAKVIRCGGEGRDKIEEFSVYSPKVFALIGDLDAVLCDRSLPVPFRRKTSADVVERYRSRVVDKQGEQIRAKIEKWVEVKGEQVSAIYDNLEPFPIGNDRMADLLLPLQAVLIAVGGDRPINLLREYAEKLDERDSEQEAQSIGVRLLNACRDVFGKNSFLPSDTLINLLKVRREEPWYRWNKGEPISREALANLLRPYGIRPARNKEQTARGYHAADFADAWVRYLPLNTPVSLTNSPKPASKRGTGV